MAGGVRSTTESPKRRIVCVMYGEIVARSSVSTGVPVVLGKFWADIPDLR